MNNRSHTPRTLPVLLSLLSVFFFAACEKPPASDLKQEMNETVEEDATEKPNEASESPKPSQIIDPQVLIDKQTYAAIQVGTEADTYGDNIALLDVDENTIEWITNDAGERGVEIQNYKLPRWRSPTSLTFLSGSDKKTVSELIAYDTELKQSVVIGEMEDSEDVFPWTYNWSHDGQSLAVVMYERGSAVFKVVRDNEDKILLRVEDYVERGVDLLGEDDISVRFSPDDRLIVVAFTPASALPAVTEPSLYLFSQEGELIKSWSGEYLIHPQLFNDLLYYVGANNSLFSYKIETGEISLILEGPLLHPIWTEERSQLVYAKQAGILFDIHHHEPTLEQQQEQIATNALPVGWVANNYLLGTRLQECDCMSLRELSGIALFDAESGAVYYEREIPKLKEVVLSP